MARRSRVSVEDILEHLESDDDADYGMAAGNDDDLGMDSDSASSIEGIIIIFKTINKLIIIIIIIIIIK